MDETRQNDVECWNDFLQGDEIAFGKIYRRFYSSLYAYGIRMVGNREMVIDTIQDLFVKLILNCKNLHSTDNPEAYLLCAFRNKLLDAIQSSRRMETIEEYQDFFSLNEEIINSLFAKDDTDVINEKKLASAIASLSTRQREILYLYYIRELSYKEITAILEMNLQSCRNLLSRTLVNLREYFFSDDGEKN
ncbi:sigma-70 family RNA polymerase sigma factor [Parabacteroides gordonii]|jgi:RNA polymerase sigma factor (sigma-70 family)|uniref:RNA polymerase sigma factor n=1 Tax=Parabacteroides gordonii TaxID=574930 RepID=UPI00241DCB31|nr:sigma-70 family RNA polymerase sigma factor [Parabacteroides gordonii]